MSGAIVIGFDGSDASEDALALGLRLARATGDAPVVAAVHPQEYESGMGRVDAEYVAYMRDQAQEMLARARRIVGDDPSVELRTVAATSAAHGLDLLAERLQATCIVIGSTQHAPLRRLFIGSTGERLLHGAACPVAVAPRGLREQLADTLR